MNTLTIDETQPVVAGKTGAHTFTRQPEVSIERFRTAESTIVVPLSFSVTKGVTKGLNMLGNAQYGCCVPAATEHARMFKALLSFENNVMTFEKGFRPPHAPYNLTLYWAFGISQGEPAPHPDQGCDPAAWFKWFFGQGLCDAYGEVNWSITFEQNMPNANLQAVKQAVVEFGGVCASFVLPQQFQSQFNVVPFSYTPGDAWSNDGHEMFITGFDDATQLFEVCTWGVIWHATYEFIQYCMTSCFVFVSKEDAENANVDFAGLLQACESLSQSQGINVSTTTTDNKSLVERVVQDGEQFFRRESDKALKLRRLLHEAEGQAIERVATQLIVKFIEDGLKTVA